MRNLSAYHNDGIIPTSRCICIRQHIVGKTCDTSGYGSPLGPFHMRNSSVYARPRQSAFARGIVVVQSVVAVQSSRFSLRHCQKRKYIEISTEVEPKSNQKRGRAEKQSSLPKGCGIAALILNLAIYNPEDCLLKEGKTDR